MNEVVVMQLPNTLRQALDSEIIWRGENDHQ